MEEKSHLKLLQELELVAMGKKSWDTSLGSI